MPYIKNSTPRCDDTNVGIDDVYHSPNVFANNVEIALWQPPGLSSAFSGITPASAITVDPSAIAAAVALTNSYVANPSSFYNPSAAADGVKGNFPGTPVVTTSTGQCGDGGADIVSWLQARLNEASGRLWRETGQGGNPSNKNITSIWTALGYPASAPWTSDQTAWCMGFVNFALKSCGYKFVQTAWALEIASAPEKWGAISVPKAEAQPGDIALWTYGHVNFVYTANNGKFTFVGGNQTPKGGTNNPSDGDVTISYPGGAPASLGTWASCWRPTKC